MLSKVYNIYIYLCKDIGIIYNMMSNKTMMGFALATAAQRLKIQKGKDRI